ncbi:hypothetical protein ACSYDW_07010 [Paeniglutamicibacter sp. R2-26]|uniref:hypothetical protein n=1 Tax=Paeniglutamicibacter sp. R2-26 TaxID=3144417 RepID=UPI003EE64BC2
MSEQLPEVHPWTIAWYESLPEAYRLLDKAQKNPTPAQWDGLTPDPAFFYGPGGWQVTDPVEAGGDMLVTMTQSFQGVAGEPVYVQAWWDAPIVTGALVQITNDTGGEATEEPATGAPGDMLLKFYPTGDGHFTVSMNIFTPAPALLDLSALNVGHRHVTRNELPVGGVTPATTRPLLRFMDGIGQVGGGFRKTSDDLWDGTYTNPATIPESSLLWLAEMMGVPARLRGQLTPVKLRAYMVDMTINGRQGAGTRAAIADAARAFLTGDRMVEVLAHAAIPHTLIILVKADEVPGGNLHGIVDTVRAAGVMPAGHDLIAKEAIATWDAWQAAAGAPWDSLEANAPTWVRHDSLGVDLDG